MPSVLVFISFLCSADMESLDFAKYLVDNRLG